MTGETEFIVIGTQAILGHHANAPAPLPLSVEANLYASRRPCLSDEIDGNLSRGSRFGITFGYVTDGLSPETATLPEGRQYRLTGIPNASTGGAAGWCIDVHDIAIAKYVAGRKQALRYNGELWTAGFLDSATVTHRLATTELDGEQQTRIAAAARHHQATHRAAAACTGPTPNGRR